MRYTISSFLRSFNDAYRSLDIRAAVVSHQGQWLLVAISAHVRIESVKSAEEEFHSLVTQFGEVNALTFRIIQQCLPYSEAGTFFKSVTEGRLVVDDLEIALDRKQDVLEAQAFMRFKNSSAIANHWRQFECRSQVVKSEQTNILLQYDSEILRAAENAGYENPHEATKKLLNIDFSWNLEGGFWIVCDIPVRLLRPHVTRFDNELHLELRAEASPTVEDLSCNIRCSMQIVGQDWVQINIRGNL